MTEVPRKRRPRKPKIVPVEQVEAPKPVPVFEQVDKQSPKIAILDVLPWIAVAVLIGVLIWSKTPKAEDGVKPVVVKSPSVVLRECQEADRKSKIAYISEISKQTFANDKAKLDWINAQAESARQRDFEPFMEILAKALFEEKTDELAASLEAGK